MTALRQEKDELFDASDFNSMKILVRIQNQTSNTRVSNEVRGFGERAYAVNADEPEIRLMELGAKGLGLDVPPRVGAVGHVVDIEIDVQGASLPLCFKVRGKVAAVKPLENERERMEVELLEVNQRFYDALISLFQKRQEEIDEFLGSMRR